MANAVIFYVASMLKDDRKDNLMYSLAPLFLFVLPLLLAILLWLVSPFRVYGDVIFPFIA